MKEYCKHENPSLPIGGNVCELCGKEVPEKKLPYPVQKPPVLGVSVSEDAGIKDKVQ